ncbi:GDSL-type esterase/lipase family protein [Streptomyces yangpuensis]|uniref:GDSL-type esterase/lipase family protein n=1 Tax=Streptomyces yangpuensis TaxID=1648182 RepID=UPI00381CACE5
MTSDGDGLDDGSGPIDGSGLNGVGNSGDTTGSGSEGNLLRWGPRLLFLVGTIVLTAQSARGVSKSELGWTLVVFAVCSILSILFTWRQLAQADQMDANDRDLLIGAAAVLCAAGVTMLVVYLTHASRNWLALIGAVALLLGLGCFLVRRLVPQPATWLLRLLTVLCTAGVTMLVLYGAGVTWDGLSLIGSVMLLLGLGYFVELWRQQDEDNLLRWGAILLGLAGLTLIVVFFLLVLFGVKGGLSVGPLVALGVAVLVLLPLGLNVLSERGLRALSTSQSSQGSGGTVRWIRWVSVAVLISAVGVAVWLAYHDWVMSAVLVGLALLLLLAIVSNTHLDVALVLAGLCALAAAPPEHPSPAQGGTRMLVAVGDSYMSGEGADSYFEGTNDVGGDHCRRAPSAYAVQIAAQDTRFDGLQFIACSGARTFHVIAHSDDKLAAHPQEGVLDTQIDQLKKMGSSLHPALVIISIGGNDAGFATLGGACIAPGPCNTQRSLFEGNLDSVKDAVKATYVSLKKALPAGVPIVAVPYPQPIANADKCSGVALTKAERDFIRKFVTDLNAKIGEATAETPGIVYLEQMERTLEDHHLQLCDKKKKEAGVNFVGLKSVSGPPAQRFNPANWFHNSLHPNKRGHEAMLATFQDWLKKNPKFVERAPTSQEPDSSLSAPTRGAVAKPQPQCPLAVIDHKQFECQVALSDWEVQQVTNRWLLLLTVLLCLLVAWAASIAIISWLR